MEQVRGFSPKYKVKSDAELKAFGAEESLRLLYVAITRAQEKLYITSALKAKAFGRETSQEPSIFFDM